MSISRRDFIQKTVIGGATLAATSTAVTGCANDAGPAPVVKTSVDDDGIIRVSVARYPDLMPTGGAVNLQLGLPKLTPFPSARSGILLVHRGTIDDPPEFIATQAACPHKGCPLGYSAKERMIECPCHGSRFFATADPMVPMSCTGAVQHPPSPAGLTTFNVAYKSRTQTVQIDLTKNVSCNTRMLPRVVDGTVSVALAEFTELQTVNGFLVGQAPGLADDLILVRVDDKTVSALSAVCTHLACDVAFIAGAGRFECPCHGSAFSLDGAVLEGPAMDPIKKYATAFDGTTVVVTVV